MKKKVMSAVMGVLFFCAMTGLSVASSDVAVVLDSSVHDAEVKVMDEVKAPEHEGQVIQDEVAETADAAKEEAMEHVTVGHE